MTVFNEKYKKIQIIGKGAFGEAWKVESRSKHKLYIMKEICIRRWSERDRQMGQNEIEILKQCKHENIVRYKDHFEENQKFLIVMEFCNGGDLSSFINKQRRRLTEDHFFFWFKQVASGLQYIHDHNILHRDLKPANIFLTSTNSQIPNLKIGDFGISKSLNSAREMAQTVCGTPCYMAPEVIEGRPYNNKADIWSLGCVLFELWTFKLAFSGGNFMYAINKVQYDQAAMANSHPVSTLVRSLLVKDPRRRPSAEDLMNGRRMIQVQDDRGARRPVREDKTPRVNNDFVQNQGGIDRHRIVHDNIGMRDMHDIHKNLFQGGDIFKQMEKMHKDFEKGIQLGVRRDIHNINIEVESDEEREIPVQHVAHGGVVHQIRNKVSDKVKDKLINKLPFTR